MTTHHLEYKHSNATLEAYVAHPEDVSKKLPAVIIMHAWAGRDHFVEKTAQYYADKGYVGAALDNYGKGIKGNSVEENSKLMTPLMEDRKFLAERLITGIEAIKALPYVDAKKIIVMGYCFGGLCALDVLRNAVEVTGIISVHGLLGAPTQYKPHYNSTTKVLALTGYNDPMVPPELTATFAHEMDQAKVDWQMVTYGNTQHAFTNPEAHDINLGLIYNANVAKRSTLAIDNFIQECFTV
jgi:dienelactone hydrolase